MLTKEDFVNLIKQLTAENIRAVFEILGVPIPTPAGLLFSIGLKLFPAYERASEEKRKEVEEFASANAGVPKAVVKPEPEPEPEPEPDKTSPLYVYYHLMEIGKLDIRNLDMDRINEQFEYKGEKFTLIMALTEYILSRSNPYYWKDLETLLSRSKVDFNVSVDGRTVEDVILSTKTDGLTQENTKNISTLISILLLNGFKFTRLQDAHGPMKELINKIAVFKKLYLPPVPSRACQYAQNWQTGDFNGLKLPGHIKPDYFYCGQYYFDGRYVVVKFPKGMSLYHGSKPLANAAVNLPLGKEYYMPSEFEGANPYPEIKLEEAGNSEFSIEELLTEKSSFTQSWFADPENAKKYSDGCCVQSYKLKHDSVFILLDNELNIETILESPDIDIEAKKKLRKMFGMPDDPQGRIEYELGKSNNPFGIIGNIKYKRGSKPVVEKQRISDYDTDKAFAAWFCNHFNESDYAGYCAPDQFKNDTGFHLEFIYCNSALYLERDLTNPVDIFYEDASLYPEKVRILVNQMRYYETTNTDFHSGNLLQHSVWTLLFTESLLGQLVDLNNPQEPQLDDRKRSIIIAAGLLHDIGKMNPNKCFKNTKRNKFIYHDIPTHPEDGAAYFDIGIPILDDNLEIVGRMLPHDILTEMIPDITPEEVNLVKDVVALHWFFGKDVVKYKNSPKRYKQAIAGYKKKFGDVLTMIATMIVSISDIEASQPFTLDKLASLQPGEIKDAIRSKVFKYIVSKPKLYRGGNIASKIGINKNGIECMNDVLTPS